MLTHIHTSEMVQKHLEKCLNEQTFTRIVSSLIRTIARVRVSVIEMHLANHFARIRKNKNRQSTQTPPILYEPRTRMHMHMHCTLMKNEVILGIKTRSSSFVVGEIGVVRGGGEYCVYHTN